MANFTHSGYAASAFNALTTELNSLVVTAGTQSTLGSEIDNSTNKYLLAEAEFLAGGTYTPTANGYIELWLLRAMDGTNYEDGSSSIVPARRPDIIIPVRAGTTITPRALAAGLLIPPGKYKALAGNRTGATLPASGNVIALRPYAIAY